MSNKSAARARRLPVISQYWIAITLLVLLLQGACGVKTTKRDKLMPSQDFTTLKVLNYNVWHGLNPTSVLRFGEYETADARRSRYENFLSQARAFDADVLFLQEVNPAPGMSRRIAKDLGMDAVWQIDNAGLKLGSAGVPTNLRSGLTILARKDLELKKIGGKKLSGPRGFCNDWMTFQFNEFRFVLAASITVRGKEILLLNTHLHHGPEVTPETKDAMNALVENGDITRERADEILAVIAQACEKRRGELEKAMAFARSLGRENSPAIFAGDFNASPDAAELIWLRDDLGFHSVTKDEPGEGFFYTWDWQRNENTHQIDSFVPVNTFPEEKVNKAIHDLEIGLSRRIDYIFYRNADDLFADFESGLFGDKPKDGRMASDHFGIWANFALK